MTPTCTIDIRDALALAKVFIAGELDQRRQAYGDSTQPFLRRHVAEAEDALIAVSMAYEEATANTPPDRTAAVAAAAAHDLRDELTLVGFYLEQLDLDGEARACVAEARAAAGRAAAKVAVLQDYAAKRGARATAATVEAVVGMFEMRIR
jgi:hypothetical protein